MDKIINVPDNNKNSLLSNIFISLKEETIPKTKMLAAAEPIRLLTDNSLLFLRQALNATVISGKLVPMAKINKPTKRGEI